MRVIPAKGEHLDDIAEINKQISVYIPGFKWDMKEWIAEEIANKNFYVCESSDGEVLGAMCILFHNGDAEMETLAVKEGRHREGIGSMLVNVAKSSSRFCHKKRLVVRSFPEYAAKDFYLKQGFILRDEPFSFGGREAHDFYMDL